jgi:N-acetyl-alpha-D-muramate 1-phosphate uridylyltransferase
MRRTCRGPCIRARDFVANPARYVMPFMPDKAMVFAAGLGTRMRPLSDQIPKPLIKIGGRALIDHSLDRLAAEGVATAVVNLHRHASQIEQHLASRGSPKIVISDEREKLLDQGGGIKKALPELGNAPFFICNTDALWIEGPRSNLGRLAAAWDPDEMDVLLLVASAATSVGVDWLGDFTMDPRGRLTRREERRVAPFVYTGVGIIKPGLFEDAPLGAFRLAPYFFEAAGKGRLFGVRLDGIWLHIGTPRALEEADQLINRSVL